MSYAENINLVRSRGRELNPQRLTATQHRRLSFLIDERLSLNAIAAREGVTKQAVADTIKTLVRKLGN